MQHRISLITLLRAVAPHALAVALLTACGSPTPTPESVCEHMASAHCASFSMSACVAQQQEIQTACASSGQSSASQSLLNCSATATFTCGADGQPTSADCAVQTLGIFNCVLPGNGDGGGSNDASTGD